MMSSKLGGSQVPGQRNEVVGVPSARELPACGPGGRRIGGVSSSWAQVGKRRTCRLDSGDQSKGMKSAPWSPRGTTASVEHRERQSIDTRQTDGTTRSSGEGLVMRLERRGRAGQGHSAVNLSRNEPMSGPQLKVKSFDVSKRLVHEAWTRSRRTAERRAWTP